MQENGGGIIRDAVKTFSSKLKPFNQTNQKLKEFYLVLTFSPGKHLLTGF